MFFRLPNKTDLRNQQLNNCREKVAFHKTIADEKCRVARTTRGFGDGNITDTFVWSEQSCTDATKEVVKQVEECLKLVELDDQRIYVERMRNN